MARQNRRDRLVPVPQGCRAKVSAFHLVLGIDAVQTVAQAGAVALDCLQTQRGDAQS
jgi:hypothetical protein